MIACGECADRLLLAPSRGPTSPQDRPRGGKGRRPRPTVLLKLAKPKLRGAPPSGRAELSRRRGHAAPRPSSHPCPCVAVGALFRCSARSPHSRLGRRASPEVCETRVRRARNSRWPGDPRAPEERARGLHWVRSPGRGCSALAATRISHRGGIPAAPPPREQARAPGDPTPRRPRPLQPRGGGFPQCPASTSPHFRCPAAHGGAEENRPPPRTPPAPRRRARGPVRGGAGCRAGGGGARGGGRGRGAERTNQQRPGARWGRGQGPRAGRARAAGAAGLERARGRAPA